MWWYSVLKLLHVMAAVTAVGANLTYRFWIRQAAREPANLAFVLASIRVIDRRVANPGYGLLLVTGLLMALTLRLPLTTPWLLSALFLYVLAALLGVLAYAPVTRRQRAILASDGFESPSYLKTARRAEVLGLLVTGDVVIIVFLMVVKPTLWG
ncbi:MAG TPA: DUF2269 family protein [Anaerolineales bacterium]|nr:DUF2269 family protein [Anaerolineales bacterium]